MRAVCLSFACFLAVPADVAAQTWRELYERGEFHRAGELLLPIVTGTINDPEVSFPDVEATEMLGRMYLEGRGLPQDTLVGCSFIELAFIAAATRPEDVPASAAARISHLRDSTCGRLSPDDRREALRMAGCPVFGLAWQTYTLDADRWVEISTRGILVGDRGRRHLTATPGFCGQHVVLVRHSRVEPPGAAAVPARHLLEWLAWFPASAEGQPQRLLMWHLMEIVGDAVESREGTLLVEEPGYPWAGGVEADLTDVAFRMLPDGGVAWRFRDPRFAGVLPPLPGVSRDGLPPHPTSGLATLEVQVVDRSGAALAGALVSLTGVADRRRRTNAEGYATFENLPDGRYDVVGSASRLVSSVPRVVDLSGATLTPVFLALKPSCPCQGPCGGATIGSGIADTRTIGVRLQDAELVLHVRVEDQRGYEEERPPATGRWPARTEIRTSSQARTIQSLKAAPAGPVPGSVVVIDQGGGRIDRGSCVDRHASSPLNPLNVGDEYVLFLKSDASGRLTTDGSAEGAFRIRNDRVEPLGAGPLARTWRGRSAQGFFDALRAGVTR